MKKIFALLLAALMLMSVCAVTVFAKGTASTEFEATSEGQDWWNRLVNPNAGWEPPSEGWLDTEVVTFDNWHYNITKLALKAAGTDDLSKITYVKVTLEMVGKDSISAYRESGTPTMQLESGEVYNPDATARFGENAPYQEADLSIIKAAEMDVSSNIAVVEGAIPAGAKVIAVNLGGFGAITEPQQFKLTVEASVEGDELPVVEEPADETAGDAPAAPAETGIVLAVLPMMAAAAAVVVSKKR